MRRQTAGSRSPLALACLLIVVTEGLQPDLVVQQMFQGLNSFTLLAVPFFLLAGQLLNSGLITDRLMRIASVMVGWIRGGLGHINVMVSMIFAGMSGPFRRSSSSCPS